MNSEITYKISKYLLFGAFLFCSMKYVVKSDIGNVNIAIIILISTLILIAIEYGQKIFSKTENKNCESICSMTEHMGGFDYTKFRDEMDKEVDRYVEKKEALQNASQDLSQDISQEEQIKFAMTEKPNQVLPSQSYDYKNLIKNLDRDITSQKNEYNEKQYSFEFKRRSDDIISNGSRAKDDVMKDETKYNTVTYHTVPQIYNEGSFEYGYSLLPPEKWYPTPPFPPVCVAEKQCPVCPVYTTGTNVDLKEWDSSRRITPPDEINVRYIEDKLNSGR